MGTCRRVLKAGCSCRFSGRATHCGLADNWCWLIKHDLNLRASSVQPRPDRMTDMLPCFAAHTVHRCSHKHVPLMTNAHSTASCQWSSRTPPGLSSVRVPAMVVAVSVLLVLTL